jgi:imidazolonepropionase-like amidohydrolase
MEASLLVEEIGMTEMEAIEAGTRVAGRTIPNAEVGTVETGKRADLAVLSGDPLDDITALEDVTATYVDGERVA